MIKHANKKEEGGETLASRFLPLHAAMARNAPIQTTAALLMAYPEAVKVPDSRGLLPLHYACGNGGAQECIATLLMMYTQGARTQEPIENSLPIHQLCQWGAISEEALLLLLMANLESIDAKNIDGKTPLQIIAETREGEEAVELAKALKRYSLIIGMNLDDKADQSYNGTEIIAELEQKLIDEQQKNKNDALTLKEEVDSLKVQIDYIQTNKTASENRVMELQGATEKLLKKQVDSEKRRSEANSTESKLRAEVEKLEHEMINF
jgi:ankyrin repeat protein